MSNRHKKQPKWLEKLFDLIHAHWQYHAPCSHLNIQAYQEDKVWHISAAPVFQEIYGGTDDGKKVWAGFIFDLGNFNRSDGVYIDSWAAASYCQECTNHPKMMGRGKFRGHQVWLHIYLEPIKDTEIVEVLDTFQKQIRSPEGESDEQSNAS